MAEERVRSTETVETRTDESQELKERLGAVQGAIEEIENQVRKDAESLQRLRSMLDTSYLDEINAVIKEMESRISDVAEEANEARRRADRAEAALEDEQERLEKLWDVYKVQEEELDEARSRAADLEAAVERKDERIDELEADLRSEKSALRQVQQELGSVREDLADAQARAEELKAYETYADKVEGLEDELEEERERLTKLYAVYEETQAERDDLAAQAKQWNRWFEAHREALQGVCKAVNEAPGE